MVKRIRSVMDWNARLYRAVENRNLKSVARALKRGADPRDGDSRSLSLACAFGDIEIIKLLIAHRADVNGLDGAPLANAAELGDLEGVKLLIAHGADASKGKALEKAAQGGNTEIAGLLIANGADVHANNEAALCLAIAEERIDMLVLLAAYRPDWTVRNHYPVREALAGAESSLSTPEARTCSEEMLAIVVGQAGRKAGIIYEKAYDQLRSNAAEMTVEEMKTEGWLIDAEGSATSCLRQYAWAGVLDVLFSSRHWQDPAEARAFYHEIERALPDYLKRAVENIDMTPFREEALSSPVPFANRARKLVSVER